jgi:hypothetical protein
MSRSSGWLVNMVVTGAIVTASLTATAPAGAATPPSLRSNVLLIGAGPSDPTTSAWQSALGAEGFAYTLATATGRYGSEVVDLPPLTSGTVGNFNAVVFADSPAALGGMSSSQQLIALSSYERSFGVRQVDGYAYPSEALGLKPAAKNGSGGPLDGSTAGLTPAGSAGLPGVVGPVTFAVGTYGYPALTTSAAFTPWLVNTAGDVLGGVFVHQRALLFPPGGFEDPQFGVSELVLTFDYNAIQSQWLQLAPDLIDWVTRSTPVPVTVNQGTLAPPVVGMAAMPDGAGYWLVNAAGDVSPHGAAVSYGSMAGSALDSPIAHIVASADGKGYWLVAADGGVFAFGDAPFYGSMGGQHLNAPVVSLAPTADGLGYWLVASDGGIFSFGDAAFHGSMGGQPLNRPVVGIAADIATGGYWLVATDGGIFSFGGAPFFGSTGSLSLTRPVNGMVVGPGDEGYWLVASDGGIFAFGDAAFHGSMGGTPLNAPIVGMAADNITHGYWLVAADGGIFSFGAPFFGAN